MAQHASRGSHVGDPASGLAPLKIDFVVQPREASGGGDARVEDLVHGRFIPPEWRAHILAHEVAHHVGRMERME